MWLAKLMYSTKWWWFHDDVIKWKHFPRYWPFVRGIHWSPVNSPHKGQWCEALKFSLICAWINGWVNNSEAGDLKRHRAHYDVILMSRNGESIAATCTDLVNALSEWETKLQCNVVSHWLGACTKWSLHVHMLFDVLGISLRYQIANHWTSKSFPRSTTHQAWGLSMVVIHVGP